jgi:thioesterase domain-containing protein
MPKFARDASRTGADGITPPTLISTRSGTDFRCNAGALNALFARTFRNSERVIFPINNSALDEGNLSPAFYCIHSLSGAGGTDFRDLAKRMPAVRFYGIQAPPKKMQDVKFGGSIESIADYYASALIRFQPKGPFLLGGWSAGAIIGLQIAQDLHTRGRQVDLLVAIDGAPENAAAGFRPWHPLYLLELVRNLPGWVTHEGLMKKGVLRSLVRRAVNKAVALGKTKAAGEKANTMIHAHAVDGFMDLSRFPPEQRAFMRRLYDALLEYKPEEYLGKVVVYEAKIRPLLHLPQVGRVWRKLAPHSIVSCVSGTHLSVLQEPHVTALAEDVWKQISEIVSVNPTMTTHPEMVIPFRSRESQGSELLRSATIRLSGLLPD